MAYGVGQRALIGAQWVAATGSAEASKKSVIIRIQVDDFTAHLLLIQCVKNVVEGQQLGGEIAGINANGDLLNGGLTFTELFGQGGEHADGKIVDTIKALILQCL